MKSIPQPTVNRLCLFYQLLSEMEHEGVTSVSSLVLGEKAGVGSPNVRKDISFIGGIGNSGLGYDVKKLKEAIALRFGLNTQKHACVVGLGRIGCALLQHAQQYQDKFRIVAGFDSSINKLETIKTSIAVFPAYQITEVVKNLGIQLAILTVPEHAAQETATRLIEGGVRGIINFTSTHVKVTQEKVFTKNIDISGELRILSALINL